MDARLKQRVIGAVVLTALAIIVLPMVLDGSSEERATVVASMPESPRIDFRELEVDEVRRRMEEMSRESAARLPQPAEEDEASQAAEDEPVTGADEGVVALDENSLPVSWTLQVGSFRDREKAVTLRESLRESAYRTYVTRANTGEGRTYRVFVGPMVQKQRLQAISREIESKFDLKGLIVRYRVEDDAGQLGG